MSKDWTPFEQFYANYCLKCFRDEDLMRHSFTWRYGDIEWKTPAPLDTAFPYVNFLLGSNMMNEKNMPDETIRNFILGSLENDIKVLIDQKLSGSWIQENKDSPKIFYEPICDEDGEYFSILDQRIVGKWFDGNLDEYFYRNERNNQILLEHLMDTYSCFQENEHSAEIESSEDEQEY